MCLQQEKTQPYASTRKKQLPGVSERGRQARLPCVGKVGRLKATKNRKSRTLSTGAARWPVRVPLEPQARKSPECLSYIDLPTGAEGGQSYYYCYYYYYSFVSSQCCTCMYQPLSPPQKPSLTFMTTHLAS